MRVLRRGRSFVLLVLVACGQEGARPGSTDATTRSLLGGPIEAGPSTVVRGAPGLTEGVTALNVMDLGYNRGSVDAPLKVIEFSDFGCGFCKRFHDESFPTLKTQFIDSNMIEWKFMPFITGNFENSLAVTEAAECVLEQSSPSYETLTGELWTRQSEWKASDEPEAIVREWVREAGVDLVRFDSCLAEDRRMDRVAGATAVATQLGIRGTPTLWLVGYGPLQGALPLDAFQGILSTIHAEIVSASPADSAPRPPGAN